MFDNNDNQQSVSQDQSQVTSGGSMSKVIAPPEPTPSATLDVNADAASLAPEQPNTGGLPGNLTTPAPTPDESAAPAPATTAPVATQAGAPAPGGTDDLLALKQQALQQLSPLVDHLDQTPEERFRTTMMMIQATDDYTKIREAYAAAEQIHDDKARAQALLDVVNEINYFTQQQEDSNEQ